MIGSGQLWCFLFVCGGGLVLLVLLLAVQDLSVVSLLSTHDNLPSGTMTATIVMMSAASVKKKEQTIAHNDLSK